MSGRDLVFAAIRKSLGVTGREATRRHVVSTRIASHPLGVVPARGHLPAAERMALFATMHEGAAGTLARVASHDDVPTAITDFLRRHNLPLKVQRGADPVLASLPWDREGALVVDAGAPDPHSLAAVSHALAGVAETGTLALVSGADNPTSLNFLPDNHIVVLEAADIVADYESVWGRLRERFAADWPRTVNLITGPSRTADIEQTLILGAHGPRRLHVILVGAAE